MALTSTVDAPNLLLDSPSSPLILRVLSRKWEARGSSSAIKSVKTDGHFVFSSGYDQRLDVWRVTNPSASTEGIWFFVSVLFILTLTLILTLTPNPTLTLTFNPYPFIQIVVAC
jgi:hypothetical protein